jgi:hypothetical protein
MMNLSAHRLTALILKLPSLKRGKACSFLYSTFSNDGRSITHNESNDYLKYALGNLLLRLLMVSAEVATHYYAATLKAQTML